MFFFTTPTGVVALPDARILVSYASLDRRLFLVRYMADGRLDTSFGTDGFTILYNVLGEEIAVQPDGKIVAVATNEAWSELLVARFLTDGTLDPSFDADGIATVDIGGEPYQYAHALAVAADGAIAVVASNGFLSGADESNMVVVRLRADGRLDTTFGPDGMVTPDLGAAGEGTDVAIQPDGKVVARDGSLPR
jgi:uncharacterized delta-60 repeat protein